MDFLIKHLPEHVHVVLITRADPTLRLGRLRAAGQLSEIRADDLAFDVAEAVSLLASDGVTLSTESMWELMRRTEGWPAGLYLAALSLAGRTNPNDFVHHFTGTNRFIVDYLTEEVLEQTVRRRCAISSLMVDVWRFSAPLCEYMTGERQSARILATCNIPTFSSHLTLKTTGSASTILVQLRAMHSKPSNGSDKDASWSRCHG
jgi:LuxR family maltose regulon positive regulatory protein